MKNRLYIENKKEITSKIIEIAALYKEKLIGKTFLILFEGKSVEIMFKAENFLHLCGVDTNLYAKDFYKNAIKGTLKPYQIGFSDIHPYVFASIKMQNFENAINMLNEDALMITDISTQSKHYKLGTTNLNLLLCFDEQLDDNDEPINEILVPYSLRIEEIDNSKFNNIYEVDYVLSKVTNTKEYTNIEYGNKNNLEKYFKENNLNKRIISKALISNQKKKFEIIMNLKDNIKSVL